MLMVEELEAAKSDVKARIRRRPESAVKARIRRRKSRDEGQILSVGRIRRCRRGGCGCRVRFGAGAESGVTDEKQVVEVEVKAGF